MGKAASDYCDMELASLHGPVTLGNDSMDVGVVAFRRKTHIAVISQARLFSSPQRMARTLHGKLLPKCPEPAKRSADLRKQGRANKGTDQKGHHAVFNRFKPGSICPPEGNSLAICQKDAVPLGEIILPTNRCRPEMKGFGEQFFPDDPESLH